MEGKSIASKGVASADDEGPPLGLQELVGGMAFHHSKEGVVVSFSPVSIVAGIKGDGNHLNVFSAGVIGDVVSIVYDCGSIGGYARSIAQIGYLIHVYPGPCELNLGIEMSEHIEPILGGIGMEIINKFCISCPYFAHLIVALCRFNENISFFALLIGIPLPISDAWLNYRDVPVSACYLLHAVQRKLVGVDREGLVLVHIVDIAPYRVQGNTSFLVLGKHCLELRNVGVAPAALVETESPEGRNDGLPDEVMEICQEFFWILAAEDEPEIDDSSDGSVDLEVAVVAVALDLNVEGIGGPEVA